MWIVIVVTLLFSTLAFGGALPPKVLAVKDGEISMTIEVCDPHTVRVRASQAGQQKADSAPPLFTPNCEKKTNLKVLANDNYLSVFTGAMTVRLYKNPARVDFYDRDNKLPLSEEVATTWATNLRMHSRSIDENEHLLGLGQDNDAFLGRLDRKGSLRDLWTAQQIRHGHVTADIPIPFFISSSPKSNYSYGIFFNNAYRTKIDTREKGILRWEALGGDIEYYFMYGASIAEVTDHFSRLSGRQPLPPKWVFGFIQSKCTYKTWDEMESVSETLKAKNIPLDAMVIDYDWAEDLNNYKWHPRWGGVSSEKISAFKSQGLNLMISNSGPMIRRDSSNFQSGLEAGIFAKDENGETMTCGHYGGQLMDFTTPKMQPWLWPQISHLHKDGITAWWLDLTEPEGEPPTAQYHEGPSAKIHNSYSQYVTKVFHDMQKAYAPEERNFILTRTGTTGIQRFGAAIWTGDTFSDYQTLEAHVPEALNAQISGMTLWTNDSGGFLEGLYKDSLEAHGALYARWLEFSAFTPITRVHHVGPSAPYMFGEKVEAISRKYIQMRYRLFPYTYSYMRVAHETGAPLMRPLAFHYERDADVWSWKDEYFFGAELLVAPILTEDTSSRSVYLPEGEWVEFETDQIVTGKKVLDVKAELDQIPVFVRKGSILPMMPLTMNLTQANHETLILHVYPTANGHADSFTVYQDDGQSMKYVKDDFTKTFVSMDGWVLSLAESNKLYAPKRYEIVFHLVDKPSGFSVNGERLEGWTYDADKKTASVRFESSLWVKDFKVGFQR